MCNWLVSAVDPGGTAQHTQVSSEEAAKGRAASFVQAGYTKVEVWERRYAAASDTRTVLTAPNGRQEVYQPEAESREDER